MSADPGPPGPRIRPVALDDPRAGADLVALRRAWLEERTGGPVDDPGFEDRARAWLAAEAGRRLAWLAELPAGPGPGRPVGMLNMLEFRRMPAPGVADSGWGYVGQMYVRAEHRDRGVGRLLLDAALAEARARGYARVVLSPSARSVPFYRRAGFGAADGLLVHPLR